MYKVVYTKTFEKDFKKLDRTVAKRIIGRISDIGKNPDNFEPLKYSPKDLHKLYKAKAGDWRMLFWIDYSGETITLYTVEHRSKIYKNL